MKLLLLIIPFTLFTSFKKKQNRNAPLGTVFVSDNFFIDKTEVTNLNYREFLTWVKENDLANYEAMLPDTAVWHSENPSSTIEKIYFRQPAYNNYPVVGVSYDQALAYSNWRSNMFNSLNKGKKVKYRLPTVTEWETIANQHQPTEYWLKWKRKDVRAFNSTADKIYRDSAINGITAPVESFFPNKIGMYNMLGNVAEMTMEQGVAKGGSFVSKASTVFIKDNNMYTKPELWLGFRCVCEIVAP